ncbi:MAG: DUF4239 domain-containing protein [Candidatus Obscuribacterales bacterium]|nr:DUF4239 domain-containing protein [Candidatus Obscuribacterales bacterium]
MDTTVLGIIVITLCTVLAVGGMLFVRKIVGLEKLQELHEISGDMLSVIGTLYAVLLGFVVVDAMTNVQNMRYNVEQEANALGNIYLSADGLPADLRNRMHSYCQNYLTIVVGQEWKAMADGKSIDEAHVLTWKMWRLATHLDASTQGDQSIKDRILEELSDLSDNRRTRLVTATHGIAPIMWVLLISGGVFTMVFTYFFGLENIVAQSIMTALIAITLSLNIWLVYLFGYPFSGDVNVTPEAFELNRKLFDQYEVKCVQDTKCDITKVKLGE